MQGSANIRAVEVCHKTVYFEESRFSQVSIAQILFAQFIAEPVLSLSFRLDQSHAGLTFAVNLLDQYSDK